jgi:DNA-binding NtrC family response regulator
MEASTILILHDGGVTPEELKGSVVDDRWRVCEAALGEAKPAASRHAPDCVAVALEDVGKSNFGCVVDDLHSYDDNLPLIVVARKATLEDAVEVMKAGAHDFFHFPVDPERLRRSVEHAVRLYKLSKKVFLLESQVGWSGGLDEMIGHSWKMQEVFQFVQMTAKSNATVLILGESGTGKELVAKAVHRLSLRKNKIFMDINCGAIPRELLENELFGHEKGAYTGADRRYIGSCERADGGILFLDEISEMDPALQVKMLRFLQERSFNRVGGNEQISVDVRVIAATNRNLEEEVREGRFREDLFYRLNVVPIAVPPLRERKEDIPLLAKTFLEKYSTKHDRMFLDFAPQAMEALTGYDWPGNVRELENIMERVTVLHNDSRVKLKYLPDMIQGARTKQKGKPLKVGMTAPDAQKIIPLDLVEKYAIEAALSRCLGNVSEAAKKLKISQATLYRKIKQYGLKG